MSEIMIFLAIGVPFGPNPNTVSERRTTHVRVDDVTDPASHDTDYSRVITSKSRLPFSTPGLLRVSRQMLC